MLSALAVSTLRARAAGAWSPSIEPLDQFLVMAARAADWDPPELRAIRQYVDWRAERTCSSGAWHRTGPANERLRRREPDRVEPDKSARGFTAGAAWQRADGSFDFRLCSSALRLGFVGAGRFELPTSRTRTVRATKLRYAPRSPGRSRRARTPGGRGRANMVFGTFSVKRTESHRGFWLDNSRNRTAPRAS